MNDCEFMYCTLVLAHYLRNYIKPDDVANELENLIDSTLDMVENTVEWFEIY